MFSPVERLEKLNYQLEHEMLCVLSKALKDPDEIVRKRSAAILVSWGSRRAIELIYTNASKYDVPSATVDCRTGIRSGCGIICCKVMFARITPEDIADGIEEHPGMPGYARVTPDGCHALDPATNRCTVWDKRPITCRLFNCKTDSRFAKQMTW